MVKNQSATSVQIRSFSWSVFSRIRTKYGEIRSIQSERGKIRTRKNYVFGHFSRSECNPYSANIPFVDALTASEKLILYNIFKGSRKVKLAQCGLIMLSNINPFAANVPCYVP